MGHIDKTVDHEGAAFIHPSAHIYGHVTLGAGSSVWINAAVRAELHEVRIGARSNIQDFVMIHMGYDHPTIIGEDCSVTHHATLHGCTLGDRCLIGINATVMDGAVIGANSIVAGHAIVMEGAIFPENSIIAGVPAKLIKQRDNSADNLKNAVFYSQNAQNYAAGKSRMTD
ncbi:gamma carbonic anhydrase family protein [Octadecabacter sp.]|nr:gamma carbonic anhydrase family protein [Octadecabacter sp.]